MLMADIGMQVPHHTEQSWSNHWQTRHDVADNILRLAEDSRVSHSPAVRSSRAARPPTTPLASSSLPSSDDEGEKERVALPAKYESPSETEDSGDDSGADDDLDAYDPEMGGSGAKMTEGDLHALAKHVASMSAGQWKRSATSRRWDRFSEIVCGICIAFVPLHLTGYCSIRREHLARGRAITSGTSKVCIAATLRVYLLMANFLRRTRACP